MIVDYSLFFDEFDMLEIRLHELADVVDRFVILECTMTFSGKPKPLEFIKYSGTRFDAFSDRLDVVCLKAVPLGDAWAVETYHRDQLMGPSSFGSDDIVILSDADEIPCAEWVRKLPELLQSHNVIGGHQDLYWYWLNCRRQDDWVAGTRATRRNRLEQAHPGQSLRKAGSYDGGWSGWHFSYMGDIQKKLASFAHTELDRPPFNNSEHIRDCKRHCKELFGGGPHGPMTVGDSLRSLPRYIQDHSYRFGHLIHEVS